MAKKFRVLDWRGDVETLFGQRPDMEDRLELAVSRLLLERSGYPITVDQILDVVMCEVSAMIGLPPRELGDPDGKGG